MRAAVHQPSQRAQRRDANRRPAVRQVGRERPRQLFRDRRQTATELVAQRLQQRARLENDFPKRVLGGVSQHQHGVRGVRRERVPGALARVHEKLAKHAVQLHADLLARLARVHVTTVVRFARRRLRVDVTVAVAVAVAVGGPESFAQHGNGVREQIQHGASLVLPRARRDAAHERGERVRGGLATPLARVLEAPQERLEEELGGGRRDERGFNAAFERLANASQRLHARLRRGLGVRQHVQIARGQTAQRVLRRESRIFRVLSATIETEIFRLSGSDAPFGIGRRARRRRALRPGASRRGPRGRLAGFFFSFGVVGEATRLGASRAGDGRRARPARVSSTIRPRR